jgi:hypothetical protein
MLLSDGEGSGASVAPPMHRVDEDHDFTLRNEDDQTECTGRVSKVPVNGLRRLCGTRARSFGPGRVCEDPARSCSEAESGIEEARSGSNASFALSSGRSDKSLSGASSAASSPDAVLSEGDSCDSSAAASFAISEGAEGPATHQDKWTPGLDCGDLVLGKVAPLLSQGQVLVMNVYVNLRRIPASLCRTVLGSLGYRDKNRNYSDWCAAAL